jgi:hypothetical protein
MMFRALDRTMRVVCGYVLRRLASDPASALHADLEVGQARAIFIDSLGV